MKLPKRPLGEWEPKRTMNEDEFEKLVESILDGLPDEFAEKIENVEFIIEPRPSKSQVRALCGDKDALVMGLYQGVPLKDRSPTWYSGVLPDRIVLFQENIESAARRPGQIPAVLKRTVLHEIAHHFGITDKRLKELGVY